MKIIAVCLLCALCVLPSQIAAQDTRGAGLCAHKKSRAPDPPVVAESPTSPRHTFDVLDYALDLDIYYCFVSPYPKSFTGATP